MFALEVEFLTGVSVAATPYRREQPEWPPHPDRVFQALVAAWGRNENPSDDERAALEWLEGLDTNELLVSAPDAHSREVVTVFVPPNDARTTSDTTKSLPVVPELRKNRQPRTFPAVLPATDRPIVRYIWRQANDLDRHRAALATLAAEVTYLGHSHTLVRIALTDSDSSKEWDRSWLVAGSAALRTPHPGRLAHLSDSHTRSVRPNPSVASQSFALPREQEAPATLFDYDNATILADDGGFTPALEAFPLVAKRLRDALLQTAEKNNLPISVLLSGHDPDGSPTETAHIAMIPLADVGWAHSGGRLMGIALVWPRTADDDERGKVIRALAAFLRKGYGEIHFGRLGSWRIALEPASDRASLRIERYAHASRNWGTVLPVVLDRHPKDKTGHDLASIIAGACLHIELPRQAVDDLDIEIHKYSSVSGAPSARIVMNSLAADSPYRNRPMRHLVLTFSKPIRGPLILGAGRFRGLGLCLPLGDGAAP